MKQLEKESASFKSRGGKRPGAERPLGSPNKLTRPLKELAALHSEDCIAVLVELRDHAETEQVRLAAANALLDRRHGRPRQEIDVNDEGHVTIIVQRSTPPASAGSTASPGTSLTGRRELERGGYFFFSYFLSKSRIASSTNSLSQRSSSTARWASSFMAPWLSRRP